LQWIYPDTDTEATAAICCIVRDEEAYLHEWIDYHLGIGFAHVYIYDNSPGFDLKQWKHRNTTIRHFAGQGVQPEAYLDCIQRYAVPRRHRWTAFFDVDEYLVLFQHSNVIPFLMDHCRRGALSVNWKTMSWSNQSHYKPLPVAKRFQYVAHDDFDYKIHFYLKSIVFLPDMDLTKPPHVHYPYLKPLRKRVDTRGKRLRDREWRNFDRPADVALLYHYHTKSWKEYIAKRSRGRAGTKNGSSIPTLIQLAKDGDGLRDPSDFDNAVWQMFTQVSPQYKMFDQDLSSSGTIPYRDHANISTGVCACLLPNEEYYIDEWVDYHLALGFSRVYLYDMSQEAWMRQWGEDKRRYTNGRVNVVSVEKQASIQKVYHDCLHRFNKHSRRQIQAYMVLLGTNEFLMVPKDDTIVDSMQRIAKQDTCAILVPTIMFGNGGHSVYEPLPVTKRFSFYHKSSPSVYKSILTTKMAIPLNRTRAQILTKAISTHEWDFEQQSANDCPIEQVTNDQMSVFRYSRSTKECLGSRAIGDTNGNVNASCSSRGDIESNLAWKRIKRYLPNYVGYDTLSW
jgi:hypothetical protein